MSNRSILCSGFGLIAVVFLLLLILPWLTPHAGTNLGNGYRVSLLTVQADRLSYTSDHEARAIFRDLGPRFMTDRMAQPIQFNLSSSQADNYLFIMFHFLPDNTRIDDSSQHWVPVLEVLDSKGFAYSLGLLKRSPFEFGKRDYSIVYSSKTFPRRESTLQLRLRDPQTGKVLLEQTVPNPGFVSVVQEWSPQPLPNTQTVGPMSLTLDRISVDQKSRKLSAHFSPKIKREDGEEYHLQADFSDVTGNASDWLSPHEPAWKVKVSYYRQPTDVFLPEETWRSTSTDLPAPQKATELTGTLRGNGFALNPKFILGRGKYRIKNGRVIEQASLEVSDSATVLQFVDGMSSAEGFSIQAATPGVWVEHTKTISTSPFIVRCRDQAGRDLQPESNNITSLTAATGTGLWIPLHVFPDSTSCDLVIIPNIERLVFEYLVKPSAAGKIE